MPMGVSVTRLHRVAVEAGMGTNTVHEPPSTGSPKEDSAISLAVRHLSPYLFWVIPYHTTEPGSDY